MHRLLIAFFVLLLGSSFVLASEMNDNDKEQPIIVASKIDTEGRLLGKLIVLFLEKHHIPVVDRTEFGTTQILRKALLSKQIHLYPEYTGNGAYFFDQVEDPVWKNAAQSHQRVKELDLQNNLVWLTPAPANNTWGIAIREDFAQKHNLKNLEDFSDYIQAGKKLKLAASAEFVNSPAALPSFEKAYNFKINKKQLLILSGGNTATTIRAAALGQSNVNASMAYGTDGGLFALKLKLLEDTKNIQPVYQPAPVVQADILKKYPQIEELLKKLFISLTLEKLQQLNAKIAVEGIPARKVALDFLEENYYFMH